MKNPSDNWEELRRKVLGLGDSSVHKTHYPSLTAASGGAGAVPLQLQQSEAYLSEAQRLSHTGSFGWKVPTGEITSGRRKPFESSNSTRRPNPRWTLYSNGFIRRIKRLFRRYWGGQRKTFGTSTTSIVCSCPTAESSFSTLWPWRCGMPPTASSLSAR